MVTIHAAAKDCPFAYYSAEGPGHFMGEIAVALGRDGEVVQEAELQNLWCGLSPDGLRKLGRTRRFPAWDVTALDPKSLPLYELTHPEATADFEAARRAALQALIRFLEEKAAFSRRGAGGEHLEKSRGLLILTFHHNVSRALQPASHEHLLVMNLTQRMDGSWGALPGIRSSRTARAAGHGSGHRSALFTCRREAGDLYRDTLRKELEARGYRTRDRADFGFELEGVSDRHIQHFSRRRREVLKKAQELRVEHGERVPEGKILQWAARSSRDGKPREISLPELRARWREELAAIERIDSCRVKTEERRPVR